MEAATLMARRSTHACRRYEGSRSSCKESSRRTGEESSANVSGGSAIKSYCIPYAEEEWMEVGGALEGGGGRGVLRHWGRRGGE
jgi:hypothetical protein